MMNNYEITFNAGEIADPVFLRNMRAVGIDVDGLYALRDDAQFHDKTADQLDHLQYIYFLRSRQWAARTQDGALLMRLAGPLAIIQPGAPNGGGEAVGDPAVREAVG